MKDRVVEGQKFAGGILTKEGAEQVNAHRSGVEREKKESVAVLLKRLAGRGRPRLPKALFKAIDSKPY